MLSPDELHIKLRAVFLSFKREDPSSTVRYSISKTDEGLRINLKTVDGHGSQYLRHFLYDPEWSEDQLNQHFETQLNIMPYINMIDRIMTL